MSIGIKCYQTRDFIRKTAQGTIDLERTLEAVRQLAVAADHYKDHSIMLDLRETVVEGDRNDTLRAAAAFARHLPSFQNKIAVIVPDTEERLARAEFMRSCMHLQGFQWEFFTVYEDAFEWLSEIEAI